MITQAVYNIYHVDNSVFWSIFYYSSIYLVLITYAINDTIKTKEKINKLYFIGFGMGLVLLVYFEIDSICAKAHMGESNYDNYMDKVNSYENSILYALFILLVISTILSKLWKK